MYENKLINNFFRKDRNARAEGNGGRNEGSAAMAGAPLNFDTHSRRRTGIEIDGEGHDQWPQPLDWGRR